MRIEDGPVIGLCACGCGGEIRERRYVYSGSLTRHRPRFINGHVARALGVCPPDPEKRRDLVPAEPIIQAIKKYRESHGLTWPEMGTFLGYRVRKSSAKHHSSAQSYLTRGNGLRHRKYVTRVTAERILRRLAGLPTLPTKYERTLGRYPERERQRQNKEAQRERDRGAA